MKSIRAELGRLYRSSQPADMSAFADHLASHYVPNQVIVDATASEQPALHYMEWMQKGLHIITPNKKLNSGPLERYLALRQFQRESYIHYFYEVRTLDSSPRLPYICATNMGIRYFYCQAQVWGVVWGSQCALWPDTWWALER
jgi:hypothetical protein